MKGLYEVEPSEGVISTNSFIILKVKLLPASLGNFQLPFYIKVAGCDPLSPQEILMQCKCIGPRLVTGMLTVLY